MLSFLRFTSLQKIAIRDDRKFSEKQDISPKCHQFTEMHWQQMGSFFFYLVFFFFFIHHVIFFFNFVKYFVNFFLYLFFTNHFRGAPGFFVSADTILYKKNQLGKKGKKLVLLPQIASSYLKTWLSDQLFQ